QWSACRAMVGSARRSRRASSVYPAGSAARRHIMRRDTPQRYGTVSRLLHWLMAILVLWQALKLFDRIDDGEHWIGQTLVPWLISIGSVLLLLIVLLRRSELLT